MVVKKSSDGLVKFYEKSHKYKIGRKQLNSVTTLIGQHFPPFNTKKVARMLAGFYWAKKQKKGVRYWLNEWKQSALEGTLCHEECEKIINNPELYNTLKDVLNHKSIVAIEGYNKFKGQLNNPIEHPELLIYNEDYNIAGQLDLPIEVNNKEIILCDWKFTKEISFTAKYEEKFGITEITKDLENCNGIKYSLQLSIYAYLLELQGYTVSELYILHINPKTMVFNPIKVDYMRDKAIELLEENKNGKKRK